jgi:prepilin-type N-terminal cleavage/methylation domain-containing protein
LVKSGADAGFTLVEMVVAMGISLIVGLGAINILTGTISAQKRLDKLIDKGFGKITYRSNGFPLSPPTLLYTVRTGWIRVPSRRALDPINKIYSGSYITPTITFTVNGADAIVEKPEWSLCASDDTVRVTCGQFIEGRATIEFELNKPLPPPEAVVRVRVQWPSLPEGHPNKSSPEYVFSIPYVRDCDLDLPTPGSPKFLEHGSYYNDPGLPDPPGTCRTDWKRYECSNGKLSEITYQKACP